MSNPSLRTYTPAETESIMEMLDRHKDRRLTGEEREEFVRARAAELNCDPAWLSAAWGRHRRTLPFRERARAKDLREVPLSPGDSEKPCWRPLPDSDAEEADEHPQWAGRVCAHILQWLDCDLTGVAVKLEYSGHVLLEDGESAVFCDGPGCAEIDGQRVSWLTGAVVIVKDGRAQAAHAECRLCEPPESARLFPPSIEHRVVYLSAPGAEASGVNWGLLHRKLCTMIHVTLGSKCRVKSLAEIAASAGCTRASTSLDGIKLRKRMRYGTAEAVA